jgi:hypothetical protein
LGKKVPTSGLKVLAQVRKSSGVGKSEERTKTFFTFLLILLQEVSAIALQWCSIKTAAKSGVIKRLIMATAKKTTASSAGQSAVIGTAEWIGTLIVLIIPIVGLVLYFVWAFGSGNLNRRNYCRAALIMMAISVGLGIIFSVAIGSIVTAAFGGLGGLF